jgi:hypothetical protein
MFTALYNRLASLTFGLWLLGGVMLFMAVGSFLQGEGSAINEVALFTWLREVPARESWWLWVTIGCLALLVLNTVLCSVESLRAKWLRGSFLIRIAPQVMHVGFLLIVLAHLFSASGASKQVLKIYAGEPAILADGSRLVLEDTAVQYGRMGMPTAMTATLRIGQTSGTTSPNHPLFHAGYGIYVKDVAPPPMKAALVEIHREPGAGAALAGALLFTAGNLVLLAKRRGLPLGSAPGGAAD